YAGIEFAAGTPEAKKVLDFFEKEFPKSFVKIRFGTEKAASAWNDLSPDGTPCTVQVGVGLKPVSYQGTARLVSAAIRYAIEQKKKSATLVHKGNIMKFTEGAFRDWGYAIAQEQFGSKVYTWAQWEVTKKEKGEQAANDEMKAAQKAGKVIIKDAIADITL